ncbi:Rrf2 family transcriptional regulator [Marinilongibacter aquaticus]|uniref:RrF2 family transcriptional regulator n=1 Tax=Marinilongibacter aquaticus TaxID=2975157 RepID=UPI0021BD3C38|nr:Rrf2 family transcriptional regulator [Marinilongibacter aquaticus]UBM59357.1 Rrf2 family transcriptional regulator [Marinilongibacter aquaticus]
MFSKACEYGIRAVIHIANAQSRVSLKSVAQAIDSPTAFTAKILQSLAQNRLIVSSKGPQGGYEMPEKLTTQISLAQIVEAIDGQNIYNACGLGLAQCNAKKPCPVHFKFKAIRDELKAMLESTSVAELSQGLDRGEFFLTR